MPARLTPVTQLAAKAKTPFPGASAEYNAAREALLAEGNGNAADIKQRVALKVLGRSPVDRQYAFAQERGWRDLNFVRTVGDDYARDLGVLMPDGSEYPDLTPDGRGTDWYPKLQY